MSNPGDAKPNDGARTWKRRAWILIVPVLAAIFETLYYYPKLPETVASHFDASGNANGWAPKASFFGLLLGVQAFLFLLFILLITTLHRFPVSLINMPRRDYWLAPERRDETFSILRRELLFFGFLTEALFVVLLHLSIEANLGPRHELDNTSFLIILGAYVAMALAWTLSFFARFLRTG